MKNIIKHSSYIVIALALCATVILGFGCAAPKPASDPLAGFYPDALFTPDTNKIITNDYKSYIHSLSPDEQKFIAGVEFFEDATGQHAVRITIGLNHTNWRHVLIYDKDNQRIKTVKYISGRSTS